MVFIKDLVVNFGIFKPEKNMISTHSKDFIQWKKWLKFTEFQKTKLQDLYIRFQEVVKI